MKLYDKRRLNAFIKDEREAVEEYQQMGIEMMEKGFLNDGNLFMDMAADEFRHAETIESIKNNIPRDE